MSPYFFRARESYRRTLLERDCIEVLRVRMITEIIIAFTLFVNAGAVLNFQVTRRKDDDGFINVNTAPSFGEKIRDFLEALRYFRAFIGLWNLFIMFLMIVFFAS